MQAGIQTEERPGRVYPAADDLNRQQGSSERKTLLFPGVPALMNEASVGEPYLKPTDVFKTKLVDVFHCAQSEMMDASELVETFGVVAQ